MSLKPTLTPAGREQVRKVVEALEALVQAKVSYDFADPRWRSGEHLKRQLGRQACGADCDGADMIPSSRDGGVIVAAALALLETEMTLLKI